MTKTSVYYCAHMLGCIPLAYVTFEPMEACICIYLFFKFNCGYYSRVATIISHLPLSVATIPCAMFIQGIMVFL